MSSENMEGLMAMSFIRSPLLLSTEESYFHQKDYYALIMADLWKWCLPNRKTTK
jgi:hypothetical protein